MKTKRQQLPRFWDSVLQGLTFWMGHRDQIYRHYPLTEAAIVTELCNLVQAAKSDSDGKLFCEVMFKEFCIVTPNASIAGKTRADLVLSNAASLKTLKGSSLTVVEVKRATVKQKDIDKDLLRLYHTISTSNEKIKAFLVVVGQHKMPKKYVDEATGKAKKKEFQIDGVADGKYIVRRVCKAAASFEKKETAYYACLIEVEIDRN